MFTVSLGLQCPLSQNSRNECTWLLRSHEQQDDNAGCAPEYPGAWHIESSERKLPKWICIPRSFIPVFCAYSLTASVPGAILGTSQQTRCNLCP